MRNRLFIVTSLTVLFMGASMLVQAHHSDTVYDQDRLVTVTGTVTKFEFVNPHTQIFLDVKDDKGNAQQWLIIGAAPNAERRVGWRSDSLKPGDQLTFTGFQFRDGRQVMLYVKGKRSSGEELQVLDVQMHMYQEYLDRQKKK